LESRGGKIKKTKYVLNVTQKKISILKKSVLKYKLLNLLVFS